MGDRADVLIVGAGVAGCATALHLARAGWRIALVDRATFPREKVCGEGLMPHGVDQLVALGLGGALGGIDARPFSGIAYHAGGHDAVGRFPGGAVGLGVRRGRLDYLLVRACQAEPGIDVRLGVRVRKVAVGARGVVARTGQGTLEARALVAADGLHSSIRRQLGLDVPATGPARYGARVHLRLAEGRRERDVVDVFAGDDCEYYITPTGRGEVNVAVLCSREVTRSFGGDLAGALLARIEAFGPLRGWLDGATAISEAMLCGPLRQQARRPVAPRTLLVGDAAGFVDAITGEGMSITLVSAALAAETLDDGLRTDRLDERTLATYARRRARMARDPGRVTELVLWGIRHRRLAGRVVRNLGRHPDAFERLLAVNTGEIPLTRIGARTLARIFVR